MAVNLMTVVAAAAGTTPPKRPNVRVGVAVFVRKNGKFLVGVRQGSHGAGTLALPGGHIDFGETTIHCATREVSEETGLEVKDTRVLPFTTNDYFEKEGKHYITLWVHCIVDESQDAEIKEPQKCAGWDWMSLNEIESARGNSNEESLLKSGKKESDLKVGERELFLPLKNLLNLLEQQPGLRDQLDGGR